MFTKTGITKSTKSFSEKTELLAKKISEADAVVVGAGAGLSVSAGFAYSGERFKENFSDFIEKYGFHDMYSGGFYPFPTPEEYWAYWSRYIYINRYADSENGVYKKLSEVIKDRDYFVISTNVDHQFQKAGFDAERIFCTQGDYGLFQCSVPCCQKTYGNEQAVTEMVRRQKNMKVPSELIPRCPVCGSPMTPNLRADDAFVQDADWYNAYERYSDFIGSHGKSKTLYLELGVGMNTPGIIKYSFWQMTSKNPNSFYVCVNIGGSGAPEVIKNRSLYIEADIGEVLNAL